MQKTNVWTPREEGGRDVLGDWDQHTDATMLTPWKESYDQPRQHIKKPRHYFANKDCLVKVMVFPVVMYRCER